MSITQHVLHNAVGDQVAVVYIGLDGLPERCPFPDVLAQQVATGDVRNAEPCRQPLSLCALAGAGRADQQKAHLITRTRPLVPSRVPCMASVLMGEIVLQLSLSSNNRPSLGPPCAARSPRLPSGWAVPGSRKASFTSYGRQRDFRTTRNRDRAARPAADTPCITHSIARDGMRWLYNGWYLSAGDLPG